MTSADRASLAEESHITGVTAVYCDPDRRYVVTLSTDGALHFWPHQSDAELTGHLDRLVRQSCIQADLDTYLPNDPAAWPTACAGAASTVDPSEPPTFRPPSTAAAEPPAPPSTGDTTVVQPVDYVALRQALLRIYTPNPATETCGCQAAPRSSAWLAALGWAAASLRRRRAPRAGAPGAR